MIARVRLFLLLIWRYYVIQLEPIPLDSNGHLLVGTKISMASIRSAEPPSIDKDKRLNEGQNNLNSGTISSKFIESNDLEHGMCGMQL